MNFRKIAITSLGILTLLSFSVPAMAKTTGRPRPKTPVKVSIPAKKSAPIKPVQKPAQKPTGKSAMPAKPIQSKKK